MTLSRFAVIAVATAAALSACRGATEPGGELTRVFESAHYIYHLSPGDQVDTLWQETYHAWLLDELKVQLPQKLEFFKYRDRAQLLRLTGEDTNGFAEVGTYRFHTIWFADNHECVHTITMNLFGLAPMLFNEGVAVAHSTVPIQEIYEPHWNGRTVHNLARQYHRTGQLPEVDELLESRDFGRFDPEMTYPVAGSFVRYLIDTGGLDSIKEMLRLSEFYDDADQVRANFQAAFGESVEDAWARWLAYLESSA